MILSNTSEYALRIMSYMSKDPKRLYSATEMVGNLNISDKYLRRLMTTLSKAGFIRSIRGRSGGYVFDEKPENITLSQVVDAVEGMEKYRGCIMGFEHCSDENPCVMHGAWRNVQAEFLKTFEDTSLADLDFDNIYKF
jgi:Rrf2 family protein